MHSAFAIENPLKPHQALEILEDVYNIHHLKPDNRAIEMIKIHEKYIKIYPYIFKNFEEKRVINCSEILIEEWGMIPLLHKYLWGTFNPVALNEDFQKESSLQGKKVKKKIKKVQEEVKKEVEEYEEVFSDDSQDDFVDLDI